MFWEKCMKVADFIINYLAGCGIREVFVVYGAANGDLIDAFTRTTAIRYVAVMHEQAGGFAAEGYAKVSGNFGVAIATSGPGGGNFVTPIQNCFYDSVPCLFITGQINSQFLRPDPCIRQIGFQETDIVGTVRGITKYAVMIRNPMNIKYELQKALYLMKDGRPGPVLIDIPLDVQKKDIDDVSLLMSFSPHSKDDVPDYDIECIDKQIDECCKDLGCAERPVMLIGGGVRIAQAVDELIMCADILNIPLFPTWNALDVVTSDLPYYGGRVGTYGGPGRNFGIQNSDLLIGIGTRISGRITGGNVKSFARGAKKYVVDVDKALLRREFQQVPCDVNIYCDAKVFLERMITRITKFPIRRDFSMWLRKVIDWREKYDPVKAEHFSRGDIVDPYVFFRILSEEMREQDILVGDCGGNIVASNHAFKTKRGQRNITNNGNSPMGFSFAASMGAWFAAEKNRTVVCTIGDGGFTMNSQEVQTFLNYGVGVKTFIIDNRIYGITKAFQEVNFNGRSEACGPKGYNPPDFVRLCGKGYGMRTFVIERNSHIRLIIREVLNTEGPVVCVVQCSEYHTYEPKIVGWKTPIEDMYPYLSREEFKANMIIDPLPGWEDPEMPKGSEGSERESR